MSEQQSETGLAAYQYIRDSGILSRCRWLVYELLWKSGPMTRNEIDSALRVSGAPNPTYSRRLTELERMDVIERIGTKPCRVTGHECDLWSVSGRMPVKTQRRRSAREELAELRKRVEVLEANSNGTP